MTRILVVDDEPQMLRAVLRRPARLESQTAVDLGPYLVDLTAYTITRKPGRHSEPTGRTGPSAVHLTPTEWRLLTMLLRNPKRLVTGRQILTEVWGEECVKRTNYLRIYIAGLRQKLEPDPSHPRYLITEPGLGYRFQP